MHRREEADDRKTIGLYVRLCAQQTKGRTNTNTAAALFGESFQSRRRMVMPFKP